MNLLSRASVFTLIAFFSAPAFAQTGPSPILHWTMDEGAGTTLTDSAGTNTGAIVGATWATGVSGSALSFNGIDNFVSGTNVSFGSAPFSIGLWFNTTSTNLGALIHKVQHAFNQNYYLFVNDPGPGAIFGGLYNGAFWQEVFLPAAGVSDGQWHHAVMVVTAGELFLYIDGVLAGSVLGLDNTAIPTNGLDFNLGRQNNDTAYYGGLIDELMMFDVALSAAEVTSLYQPPSGGPVCGNGAIETGEPCDDGNTVTEACAYGQTSCTVCDATCQSTAGAVTFCGDSNVNGPELCDDGANNGQVGRCNTTCDGTVASPCGNGALDTGETCDDGNTVTEACAYGQTSCTVCDATCQSTAGAPTFCGDATVNGPETCDDGNTITEICAYGQASCTVCDATCQNAAGAVTGFCGDSTINGPETCDDGNAVTEACAYGQVSCSVCDATCQSTAGAVAFCGDATVNGTETCDDGNTVSGDGCSATCQTEAPPFPAPILHWDMDAGSGTTIADAAGSNNGTIVGATWAAGVSGGGLSFDGLNDFVDGTNLAFAAAPFTIGLWFNTTATAPGALIHKLEHAFNQNYYLYINESSPGGFLGGLYDGVNWQEIFLPPSSLNDGQWHQAVMVVNATTIDVYIDGTILGSASGVNGAGIPTNVQRFNLGRQNNGRAYYSGLMDELTIFDVALTAAEVNNLYLVHGSGSGIACGNGVLESGEQCDDGNTVSGDGCSATCVVEVCGDGICNNGETTASCLQDCPVTCTFTETFGTGNAPNWPAPWTVSGNVATADVVNGWGRLVPGLLAHPYSLGRMTAPACNARNAEVTYRFQFTEATTQGMGVYVRSTGGFFTQTVPAGRGYVLFHENFRNRRLGIWKEDQGVESEVLIPVGTPVPPNQIFRARFRVEQLDPQTTRIRGRMWPDGTPEPSTWTLDTTDQSAGLQNVGGMIAVDSYSTYLPGSPNTPADMLVDDIVLTELP